MATYKCAQCGKTTEQFNRPGTTIHCANTAFHKRKVHVRMVIVEKRKGATA